MPEPHIVIGTPNLSSWSMRPWLLMHDAGVPFGQTVIDLERPDRRQRILEHSPAGRVPVLKTGADLIWESLAICEYPAEATPGAAGGRPGPPPGPEPGPWPARCMPASRRCARRCPWISRAAG